VVSTRVKQRIFFGALLCLVIWPLVHHGLSRRFHIDAWRFAGFAMYSRPANQVSLQFAGTVGDQPLSQSALRAALGDQASRVDQYQARRRLWGDLLPPDPVAALVFERLPELGSLTITVITTSMESGADRFTQLTRRYTCTRGGAACVARD
jgi:hypothetical protein